MSRPVTIALTAEVPAPPEVVWRLITAWERQGEWMLEARDFRVLGEQREGVGVQAEATVSIGGITTHDRIVVTEWEPPRLLGIRHLGWVSGEAELRLDPAGDSGTAVAWQERLHPPLGPLGALGLRLFRPLLRRTFARDLRVLAELGAHAR